MTKIKSLLSHIWFYYKWYILVGALVLLVVTLATVQCATKETPDVNILYIGNYDAGDRDDINDAIKQYYGDVDGDGKKVLSLAFMPSGDEQTLSRLQTEVVAGEHVIYILDRDYYDKLLSYNVLSPLKDVLGEAPKGALDDYGVPLKYLDLSAMSAFRKMPRNCVLCIRNKESSLVDYKDSSARYENNVKLFKALVNMDLGGLDTPQIDFAKLTANTFTRNGVFAIEESMFAICKQQTNVFAPVIGFEEYGLHKDEGITVFEETEMKKADELAVGNKILFLDKIAYEYLSAKGMLYDISGLEVALKEDEKPESYGVLLEKLPLSVWSGFSAIDSEEKPTVYICATAGIEGRTLEVFKYLLSYKY